jgi:8-oxo-dGTP pyrophosphatase MutT (NUDIX family)
MLENTTLCYIENEDSFLMLHRTKKKEDINKDKWIGIGGHLEEKESPEDGILREAREEIGYELRGLQFRGIVTFVCKEVTEYMNLFTASGFAGKSIGECPEGELEWVKKERIFDPKSDLELWAGDKIFFRLLEAGEPFFSLKLVYSEAGILRQAVLNGTELELFDVLDEQGHRTGMIQERGVCHREGDPHASVHMWVMREVDGRREVLLQKRSLNKDSNPGCYDISSAGHMSSGEEALPCAVREIGEELGLRIAPEDLEYVGIFHGCFDSEFYGRPFHDREFSYVYLLHRDVEEEELHLQESEVESVRWMDFEKCREAVRMNSIPHCIYAEELDMLDFGFKMT